MQYNFANSLGWIYTMVSARAGRVRTMQYVIVGILRNYGDAEAAVEDLEVAGIDGNQVEVITDIDEDARTANTPGEASTKPHEPHRNWIERLFGVGGPLE